MSVYDKQNIYPSLEPSCPDEHDEGHVYRLKKVEAIEAFLRAEISAREKLAKKFKRFGTTARIVDTCLITTTVFTGGGSIATLSTGIGAPISIALASISLVLSLGSGITRQNIKLFDTKSKKHDKIKLLAETKLDSISETISQAIQDSHISPVEYQRILKEVENYRVLKDQIRQKSKRIANTISEEQRQAILDQGRQQGKQDFLEQIKNSSATQPVSAM